MSVKLHAYIFHGVEVWTLELRFLWGYIDMMRLVEMSLENHFPLTKIMMIGEPMDCSAN